jgi:HK97 family phage major capsid protein
MSLNTTSGSLELPPVDSGLIFTSVRKSSAFAAASNSVTIPGSGTLLHTLGDATAYVVGEGAVKTESTPAVASKLLQAHTFAVLVVVSNQLLEDASAVVNAVREQAPSAIAKKFDSLISGLAAAAPANFAALGDADEVTVTDYASWNTALATVAGAGHEGTAVVLSTAMKYYLAGLVNANGVPVFTIDGTTINGLPYYTYNSATFEGFVGPFNRAVAGNVNGVKVAISDSAVVDGVSMFETNSTAIRVEARLGYQVADVAEFVKIIAD